MRYRCLALGLACIGSVCATGAIAADPQPLRAFERALDAVQEPFRVSASYARTGNTVLAVIEIEEAIAVFNQTIQPFAATPPDWFSADDGFAKSLTALRDSLIAMQEAGSEGNAEKMVARAETYRAAVTALHLRSGLYTFRDCAFDLTATMDTIWDYRDDPQTLVQPDMRARVATAAGALAATVRRCDGLASDAARAEPSYARLMGGMIESLIPLDESIAAGDFPRFLNVIREQRSLERLIFFNFG